MEKQMGKKNESIKPWKNRDGTKKDLEELKELSKTWSPEDWEEYLSDQERPLAEDRILAPEIMETFSAEECARLVFSLADEEKHTLLKTALKISILSLSPHKRRAITKFYWGGMTITEIAREANVSKPAIHKALREGINQLKEDLTTGTFERRLKAAKELLAI